MIFTCLVGASQNHLIYRVPINAVVAFQQLADGDQDFRPTGDPVSLRTQPQLTGHKMMSGAIRTRDRSQPGLANNLVSGSKWNEVGAPQRNAVAMVNVRGNRLGQREPLHHSPPFWLNIIYILEADDICYKIK